VKAGTDSRTKTWVAIGLGVIALLLVVRAYFSNASQAAPATTTARSTAKANPKAISSLDPTLRTDLLRASEQTKYEGKGRNIFLAEAEPLPEVKQPVMQEPPKPVDQGPPPPPPINMKFIGFASKPGEQKKIFLMQNEDVFVATEGEIVNRRYKVVKINPNSVEIEDVLNNNHQSIPLSQS